jgi:hypothetical protein
MRDTLLTSAEKANTAQGVSGRWKWQVIYASIRAVSSAIVSN